MQLKRLRHSINLCRRYPHWNSHAVIFVHVPKAAGTSINRALYGRTLGHYTAAEIRARFPSLYSRSFVFSVVRNPWDRLLSAYRFSKIARTETMGIALPERYQIPEFATFERFLFEWLAYQDLYESDFVFQPQSRFVCDPIEEGRIIVDYLGKFETLDTDMKYVAGQIGRSFNVRRSNVTKQPCSDFRGEYKSPEMIDIVGSLYRTDVQLFDYGFES